VVAFVAIVSQPYLENIPREDALQRYLDGLEKLGALNPGEPERIPVEQCRGRITAQPVFAVVSSPHYHAAAMDGIAVKSADTFGASETTPLVLKMGEQAAMVDTGDTLPEGFNAVIMIEDTHFPEEGFVEIISSAAPWQHVRVVGEDFIETEMVMPSHQRIRPYDLGGLLTAGLTEVDVFPKVRVALLPTGTEIVAPGTDLKPGDVIESNSRVLGGLVEEWGGIPIYAPPTIDDYDLLKERIQEYLDKADVLAVIAGSSHYIDADMEKAEMTVKPAEYFGNGLEVICRYRAVGSFMRRYGMYAKEGQPLDAFVEFTLKDDARQDPPITEDALVMLGILTSEEYKTIKDLTREISGIVKEELAKKGIELYDIKFEFGRIGENKQIALIDEISGGNMRAYKDGKQIEPLLLTKLMLEDN
jgi:hypothetical protein